MEAHGAAAVIFGLDPLMVSTGILIVTYAILLSEKINRTIVALMGAGVVVVSGVLTQDQAFAGIDFNTIALLTGMMIIVSITRQTGLFEFVALWGAKKVKADPRGILIMLTLVTAVFSGLLDNLTTVLLVVPIALLIVDKLKVSPIPFLMTQIFASNFGGTATLIGDPPNILIGSATGFTFNQFLFEMGPLVAIIMIIALPVFHLIWGRGLTTTPELKARVMAFEEKDSITDPRLLKQCVFMLVLTILGFIIGEHFHIRPGTTAMMGAALLMLITTLGASHGHQSERINGAFNEVEWGALFFFMGLFVVVTGVEHSGLLEKLGHMLMEATGGDPATTTFSVLWASALISAALDNIPFVATMIPLVESLGPTLGGAEALEPVWWALAMGACLGGNGSLIGAAANVMVAGLSDRAGHPIGFVQYLKVGMPIMLATIVIAHAYLYLVHYF